MKQISLTHHFLMKSIRQLKLIIIVIIFFSTKLFAQQIINNGGTIVMSGAAYMVVNNASFINNGTFTPSTSTVSFTGTTAYSVGTTASSATNFYNLTNTNTQTGTVNPLVTVANTLSVTAGTLACGGGTTNLPTANLTLLSTNTNTANVSSTVNGTTSTGLFTGYVNVQRYVPYVAGRRGWHLFAPAVMGKNLVTSGTASYANNNINSIFSNWQNGGVSGSSTPGVGMLVSGTGGTSSPTNTGNGLDATPRNNYSLYTASGSSLLPVTNTNIQLTNSSSSVANTGYFAFIRGDRSTSNNVVGASNFTTLTSTGMLLAGSQKFLIPTPASAGFAMLANPYASPIDYTVLVTNSTSALNTGANTDLGTVFYTWDPSLNVVGGYVTVSSANSYVGTPTLTPSASGASSSNQKRYIQSGQAFYVPVAATATIGITFTESSKNATLLSNTSYRPMEPTEPQSINGSLSTNLYLLNADSSTQLADGNLTQFNNRFSEEIKLNEDASKLINTNETFGLVRHGITLAIESRPSLSITDTLFLNLSRTTQRAYQFQFVPTNLDNNNLVGYLQDKYLNTSTEISLSNNTPINFSVDGNAASAVTDRFQIVFKTVLPFVFTNITAAKNNSEIAVEWKVTNETDIVQYDVEKSTNGTTFTKMNTNLVKGNNNAANNYIWLDGNAQTGDNIYRVKMLGKDGSTKYTDNVRVAIAAINTGISIYPNPIKEGKINIQMGNQPSGNYNLSITNNNGQVIYTGTIQNNSNKSNFLINLNTNADKCIYNLQITTPQNKITTQKLIVE